MKAAILADATLKTVPAVADGRIAESDIDAHVLRILRYKQAQGWIE